VVYSDESRLGRPRFIREAKVEGGIGGSVLENLLRTSSEHARFDKYKYDERLTLYRYGDAPAT